MSDNFIRLDSGAIVQLSQPANDQDAAKQIVQLHKQQNLPELWRKHELYIGKHDILSETQTEPYKPDNRLVTNYAKYLADTFTGYQYGIPASISDKNDEAVEKNIQAIELQKALADIAKSSSIYGKAYAVLYHDDNADIKTRSVLAMDAIVARDPATNEVLYAVHAPFSFLKQGAKRTYGEFYTKKAKYSISLDSAGGVTITDPMPYGFAEIPVVEFDENSDAMGVFDSVTTLINAYNKAISEKANDVDYFADAYLKVTGVQLDQETAYTIKENRIFNAWSDNGDNNVDMSFVEKPNADTTQEHLLDRLKESIFAISMVSDISQQDFGNASGTALAYRMQAMDNLAKVKDAEMDKSIRQLLRVASTSPRATIPATAADSVDITFSRNIPLNLESEAKVVNLLDGQVSDRTKLSVLSIVKDPQSELAAVEQEKDDEYQAMDKRLGADHVED